MEVGGAQGVGVDVFGGDRESVAELAGDGGSIAGVTGSHGGQVLCPSGGRYGSYRRLGAVEKGPCRFRLVIVVVELIEKLASAGGDGA